MAMDSSMYACTVPAATYVIGDRIAMHCIDGASVVRDGYGAAYLKSIFSISNTLQGLFKVVVKNQNWVDSMSNPCAGISDTSLSPDGGCFQDGNNCPLQPNTGWDVYLECVNGGVLAATSDAFAVIDVDYPSVNAVKDPRSVTGYPVTIDQAGVSYTITAKGTVAITGFSWKIQNLDVLKAGHQYLISQAAFKSNAGADLGFIKIMGASGQNGLQRIIPCRTGAIGGIKYPIYYSTPLVKGPMDLYFASVGATGADTAYLYIDWIKRTN